MFSKTSKIVKDGIYLIGGIWNVENNETGIVFVRVVDYKDGDFAHCYEGWDAPDGDFVIKERMTNVKSIKNGLYLGQATGDIHCMFAYRND